MSIFLVPLGIVRLPLKVTFYICLRYTCQLLHSARKIFLSLCPRCYTGAFYTNFENEIVHK